MLNKKNKQGESIIKTDINNKIIKVGSLVIIDSGMGREYPDYCGGRKGVVVKIGNKYCKVECSARNGAINVKFKNLEIISRDRFDSFDSNWLNFFYIRNANILTNKERA
jgi:hypothetical protein|tara:strand:+ start:931 stop:1257 length:327 start_codon:yes stop_codon:yes gene_type:complete